MGWDGAGSYVRVHNFSADASAGIKILASRMDAEINDIASAIPIAWARDGQNVPTVDLPMGGKKFVNVGAPTSVGNFMRVREFIENVPIFMQDAESSADRISVSSQYFTSVSSNQAPVDGTKIMVRVNSNKSSAVLYVDGHSANVTYQDGNRIGPALVSGGIYEFTYSSVDTAWVVPAPTDGRTAAEIAAGVTPTSYQYEPGSARRYGVIGDGVTDDILALRRWVSVAKQLTAPKMVLEDNLDCLISDTLRLDVPDRTTIEWNGRIRCALSDRAAIILGSSGSNTFFLTVTGGGLDVRNTTYDTDGSGSIGVHIDNLVWAKIRQRFIEGFHVGMYVAGTQANGGVSHCHFHLGYIGDNRYNLFLTASGSGYCNENSFYGGSFNFSSTWAAVVGNYSNTFHIYEDYFASSPLNNNKFYGPSLETGGTATVAAKLYGQYTHLYAPRLESGAGTPADYKMEFPPESLCCRVFGGFEVLVANITDLGSGNQFFLKDGLRFGSLAGNGATYMKLHSLSGNGATRLLAGHDTGDNETSAIMADGTVQGLNLRATAQAVGTAGTVTLGDTTQTTVGAAGAASALPATPTGYLRFFVGTTEFVIPYYAQA